jgi:hypothetical protein
VELIIINYRLSYVTDYHSLPSQARFGNRGLLRRTLCRNVLELGARVGRSGFLEMTGSFHVLVEATLGRTGKIASTAIVIFGLHARSALKP